MGMEDGEKAPEVEELKSGSDAMENPGQEEEEDSSSEDDYSSYTDSEDDDLDEKVDAEKQGEEEAEENFEEEFKRKLEKRTEEEKAEEEEIWNFPPDKEHWTEEDLGEHWEDYWGDTRAVGWDPNFVSESSWERYEKLWEEGKPGPPGTPYYVPYRKFYPPIPDNHFDIQTPEDVVEELERTEEFLLWYSYLFKDGSSYEGTVWDDLAHGKGVYTTALDLIKYEGDWFQNMMQGHGVIEADIPVDEPIPDTEEAAQAKAEGQLLRSDYMDPFDREWLKMDAEEQFEEHGRVFTPWEEKEGWIEEFGELPEKGHYKYAGQWKHSRFHGCGVYEVNGRAIWGKFYFGELLPDPDECTIDYTALHAGLAEVAAAKARMFANKPDGMVRQVKGPFTDPSHPYMYEEEDLWMAPGFINAYYEVPEDWKVYVEELDGEREMWLNSFYKAPFVVPMPPELEYLWSQEDEYVVLGNTPSAMGDLNPENVERASEDLQGEVLLHVPTGRIINWYTDKEGQLRFFYQPITENGEVIPEAIIPIPTGFDEALKDEENVSEEEKNTKKNFFQRLKEGWMKTSEDYQKDRKRRIEELKKKWKQEDEAAEYQRKLKKAEWRLAFQIELEKRRAKKMSKSSLEGELIEAGDSLQGQPEPVEEAKSLEADVNGSNAEEESKESEENDSQGNQEEDMQEDNEDDKKPKSFGKVAMFAIEHERAGCRDVKHEQQERGFISPTAFASLTLVASKIHVGELLKTKGLLGNPGMEAQRGKTP
ncbi:hypothetical protein GOP47_0005534 [Adiantum capillus-veneris]|uniref:MORN repeat-containing protein n=1 Tax=Adiantum capillus-veneris TaxID=13818 RepID=A0A9D4V594_ADICA|nr:hypothetical protein GOP47_0005534 [Adiantum capillus-veneris]